jgi:hypothetical protein
VDDHVGRSLAGDRAITAGDAIGGVKPSDHRAILCDVRWSTAPLSHRVTTRTG